MGEVIRLTQHKVTFKTLVTRPYSSFSDIESKHIVVPTQECTCYYDQFVYLLCIVVSIVVMVLVVFMPVGIHTVFYCV